MTANGQHETHGATGGHSMGGTVRVLERLDNWAHVIVAVFFILMATTVIVHISFIFLRQLPLIVPAAPESTAQTSATPMSPDSHSPAAVAPAASAHADKAEGKATEKPAGSEAGTPPAQPTAMLDPTKKSMQETSAAAHSEPTDPFVKNSLELLSNILFVVILLELLRTIITYLETHDIQAIMQEFLVVGIISSVRKILLVGAEASLRQGAPQSEFIMEASGVVIDILGILLLILGLVILKRAFGSKAMKEPQEK